jgi:hypothetical protein
MVQSGQQHVLERGLLASVRGVRMQPGRNDGDVKQKAAPKDLQAKTAE